MQCVCVGWGGGRVALLIPAWLDPGSNLGQDSSHSALQERIDLESIILMYDRATPHIARQIRNCFVSPWR